MITRKIAAVTLSVLSFSCYAAKMDFNLYGGAEWARLSNNQFVQIDDSVQNQYQTNSRYKNNIFAGIGLGHTFENVFQKPLNVSTNVSAYFMDLKNVNGVESPFINAGQFDMLNYQFSLNTTALMIEPRLLYTKYQWQPYFLAGIGVAWNKLSNYQETPVDPTSGATALSFYRSNTTSSFSYEVGIGVQRAIYHDTQYQTTYIASIDYRYMNFGSGCLGNFSTMTTNDHLGVSTIAVQAIVVTLGATI